MKRYRTHEPFRDALPGHLERRSRELGVPVELLRRRLVFQRFLARLLQMAPNHWILSGGTALDWRLAHGHAQRARTTVDLDFVYRATLEQARAELERAAEMDLGDYFTFAFDPTARTAEVEGRSFRFRITASLGPRPYLMFLVDVGMIDLLQWTPDRIVVADPFGDLGFGPLTVRTLPIPHQIAEKVHAITNADQRGPPTHPRRPRYRRPCNDRHDRTAAS